MELTTTKRGFSILYFDDSNKISCSLQKSSAACEEKIWFGCNDADPRIFIHEKGWVPVAMPDNYIANTRMHLTREQVAEIIPYLQYFVDTGELTSEESWIKLKHG